MSQFTDFAENKIADYLRGQGLSALPANWYFALGSAASDSSFTEVSFTGYARYPLTRSLANFAGTQGPGSVLASSGASHTTSNNVALNYGTAGSSGGTCSVVGMFDASTGGNCWAWLVLDAPFVINNGSPVSLPAGLLQMSLGIVSGASDYCANKLVDLIWRAQAYTWPATLYGALYTAAPSNAGGGTEVSASGYSRPSIASSLTAWSGTQAAGSTTASSGTGGLITNNAPFTYPVLSAYGGVATHEGLLDASTAGNLMFWRALASPQTLAAGGTGQSHAAGSMGILVA